MGKLFNCPVQVVEGLSADTTVIASPAAVELKSVRVDEATGRFVVTYRLNLKYAAVVRNIGPGTAPGRREE